MNNFLYSYTDFIRERNFFKMVDDKGMNRYDSPSALYYKIVFYFTDDNGLLGVYNLSYDIDNDIANIKKMKSAFKRENRKNPEEPNDSAKKINYRNTAYNYLLVNDEVERAEMLKQFIILLSDINSSAPWYFQEIAGLDGALERKIFSEGEVKLEDKPRQITIKCLKDAYDNRIGTLLDLYRASCFSYQNKKEIVPANLRKFNMGILVFNAPIRGKSGKSGDKHNMIFIPDSNPNLNPDNSTNYYYVPSAKLIELRNCEFDYNSAKSAWSTLNTTDEAFSPEYTITIKYDDAYESRYNEIMEGIVTDFINIDILSGMNEYSVGRKSDYVWDNSYYGNTIDGNEYDDINPLNTKTIDYNKKTADLYPMKISFDKDVSGKPKIDEKGYWLNSDISKINSNPSEIYEGKLDFGQIRSEDFGTAFGANILTSQLNNLKDKVSDFIQLPSINMNDNIHDYGTVNKLGEFEYLNRISGLDGFVGDMIHQAAGTASSAIKDKVSQVYLGNIQSLSVSNMLDMDKKNLSGDKSIAGSKLPEYNGKDNPEQRNISETYIPLVQNISGGRLINRDLNKGTILDVDDLNHTIYDEERYKDIFTETHYAIKNIHENTSKTSIPRSIPKKINDPERAPTPEFITTEIWTDQTNRDLGFDPVTKEIHDGGIINRELDKGLVLDVDVINHTMGSENELAEVHFTTKNIHENTKKIAVSGNTLEVKNTPTGNPIQEFVTTEIWTDPFQRNIDSDTIGELPGYIKGRTKLLNEMNTKQSIRNNI